MAFFQQVVSDKVLVKQLQREVARLEAELRVPDSPSSTSSTAEALLTSEALLQAKEEQIRKVSTLKSYCMFSFCGSRLSDLGCKHAIY